MIILINLIAMIALITSLMNIYIHSYDNLRVNWHLSYAHDTHIIYTYDNPLISILSLSLSLYIYIYIHMYRLNMLHTNEVILVYQNILYNYLNLNNPSNPSSPSNPKNTLNSFTSEGIITIRTLNNNPQ